MITMLIITMASLTLALVMSVVAWRSIAEERRRSEARVRALAAGIVKVENDGPVLDRRPVTTSADLFAILSATSGARVTPLRAGIAFGVFVVAAAVALALGARGVTRTASKGPAPAAAAPAASLAPKPLELLALDHQRDGNRLTVRGVVHNPSGAAAVTGVIPVVFVFDHNGGFVASGRGTLGAGTLDPGADSTFVVAVPDVADVGRYRVSFRTDDRVLAHVDRRPETRN